MAAGLVASIRVCRARRRSWLIRLARLSLRVLARLIFMFAIEMWHESLEAEDVAARAVEAVRAAIPGTPFGVSTGAWIVPDVKARHEKVAQWKVLPPFASVNFNEEGGVALAELLRSQGVGIEAGIGSAQAVEALVMWQADRQLMLARNV